MKYTKLVFDMDGTLTESRSELEPAYIPIFEKLCSAFTVAVISGADVSQMKTQIPFERLWDKNVPLCLMAQNGNVCIHNGEEKWRNVLFWRDKLAIFEHIRALRAEFPCGIESENDLVEDRMGQIAFSFIGHHAPRETKMAFDKNGAFRAAALAKIQFQHPHIEVKIGGTTTLDYIPKNGTKAGNVTRLFGKDGLKDALFIGDKLIPGGNDAVMLGVADCVQAETPHETFRLINRLLNGEELPKLFQCQAASG